MGDGDFSSEASPERLPPLILSMIGEEFVLPLYYCKYKVFTLFAPERVRPATVLVVRLG